MRTGDLYTDTLNTGADATSGVITGNWSLNGTSNLTVGTGYIDARTGTLYSDTLTTGGAGTAVRLAGAADRRRARQRSAPLNRAT